MRQDLQLAQLGLRQSSQQHPQLWHHPNAGLHMLSYQASAQGPQQQPAQQHPPLQPAAQSFPLARHALSAAQHASSSLPPWWTDPFASASAAAVAAAGSSTNPAAAYANPLTSNPAALASADPAGPSANPPGLSVNPAEASADPAGSSANPAGLSANPFGLSARSAQTEHAGRHCFATKMPGCRLTAAKPRKCPSSERSTDALWLVPADPADTHGTACSHRGSAFDIPYAPLALPLNRPFIPPASGATAPAADATAEKSSYAHAQVVRQLWASRTRSSAHWSSDQWPSACSLSAQAAPQAAAAGVAHDNTVAAVLTAGDTGSLLPASGSLLPATGSLLPATRSLLPAASAPPSPQPSVKPTDWSAAESWRQLSRTCLGAGAAGALKLLADTKGNASAEEVAAAASRLASLNPAVKPAVTRTQHQASRNALLLSDTCPHGDSAAPQTAGAPQDKPSRSEGSKQNFSGSQGPGVALGSAAAMPPPAPRPPTAAAADVADLLCSPASYSRDMHSLGAGLLSFPDHEDLPTRLSDPGGSETMQSGGGLAPALPVGLNDLGRSSTVFRMSSSSRQPCWQTPVGETCHLALSMVEVAIFLLMGGLLCSAYCVLIFACLRLLQVCSFLPKSGKHRSDIQLRYARSCFWCLIMSLRPPPHVCICGLGVNAPFLHACPAVRLQLVRRCCSFFCVFQPNIAHQLNMQRLWLSHISTYFLCTYFLYLLSVQHQTVRRRQ